MIRWPIILAVVLLPLAFLAGRRSAPERVVTRDVVKVETRVVERVRTVEVHDLAEAKATAEKVRTVVVTRTRWLPGGAVEAETTTTHAKDAEARAAKQARATVASDATRAAESTTVELHTVERVPVRPDWSVAVMPGVDLRGASALPYHAVVGVSLERRVLGPVLVGAWGNTAGAVGLTFRLEM